MFLAPRAFRRPEQLTQPTHPTQSVHRTHATQPTHRVQAMQARQATHSWTNTQITVNRLAITPTLPAVAADPATATLPAVATDPATATLPADVADPATATLPATAAEPATARLSMTPIEPTTVSSSATGFRAESNRNAMRLIMSSRRVQQRRDVARHTMCFTMDLERITHPLRLARGSHHPGSAKGCAMNVISYINGDERITDFPATSARPLAAFVQLCNDQLAGPDGYLAPADAVVALDLGWLTVGTADVGAGVARRWVSKLLISPPWGVIRYAEDIAAEAISTIAELHRTLAPGELPDIATWDRAGRVAREVSAAMPPSAQKYAVRAAYQSTLFADTDDWDALDAVTGNALRAHRLANLDGNSAVIVAVTRHAIRSWRRLAGLSVVGQQRQFAAA